MPLLAKGRCILQQLWIGSAYSTAAAHQSGIRQLDALQLLLYFLGPLLHQALNVRHGIADVHIAAGLCLHFNACMPRTVIPLLCCCTTAASSVRHHAQAAMAAAHCFAQSALLFQKCKPGYR